MRQTKRAFDRIFSFIVFILIGVSAIAVFRNQIGTGIQSLFPQKQTAQSFAQEHTQVEEKVEVMAQAQQRPLVTGSVLQATSSSGFVNDYLVNPAVTVKYEDIGYQVEVPELSSGDVKIGEESEGGGTSFCSLGDNGRSGIGIGMQLREAPIIPGFYYKGVTEGLPKREAPGVTLDKYMVASESAQKLTPEQMLQFCEDGNDQFRTLATFGLEASLERQAPWFWKVCATQARTRPPGTDPQKFSETWRETDQGKQIVAYRIGGWSSRLGLSAPSGNGIVAASNAWAFDPPGKKAVAADATATAMFNHLYPPTSDVETEESLKEKILARNDELIVNFTDIPVLKAILAGNGFVLNDKDTKNVRLSYRPDRQENNLCDIDEGECPLIEAKAECTGLLGAYLKVTAMPGLVGFFPQPDWANNASADKSMQRAMLAAFASVKAPNAVEKKASKVDILRASKSPNIDSSCNSIMTSAPTQLTPSEVKFLEKQFTPGLKGEDPPAKRESPAVIFYNLRAKFKGDVPTGTIFGNKGIEFDGDVTVFTAIPLINLDSYAYYSAPTDPLQDEAEIFKERVIKESGMEELQYRVKCSGTPTSPEVKIEFRNVR
ncbi:MAG: hypothetical protein QY314_03005 [Candidatus Dojkabacteria bacterium]|nr:MAG: hypothetical protein QY314_03005 [Candidatus Dojkabacteria bacterium]